MPSRRDVLRWAATGGLGGFATTLAGCGLPREEPAAQGRHRPDFRVAFLTDMHVFGELGAGRGTRRAFEHALAREQPPELLVTGGDLVFDVLETGPEEADAQFDLLDAALEGVGIPVHHVMGNHDLLGVDSASGMSPDHELYGKAYFKNRFGLDRTYRSFDHEEWHFVLLDTQEIVGRGYRGFLDEEQLAWLEDDLARAGKKTVVVGHMPLFSNFIEWREGSRVGLPDTLSVANAHRVAEILERHPVSLVLAGHLHVNESYRYKGMTFANVGAVSGNWWKGLRDGFQEGYVMLEFRGDEVAWSYVDYGWEAAES